MGSFPAEERLDYPEARRDETVVDNYHGVLVHDPYRWLEDPGAKEVKDFVEKQVSLTESLLQTCETRGKLRERLTTLFDHPKYGCPYKRGDKYFYTFNTGLQAQSVVYIQENLEAEAEVLLDPNTLSEDGTTALASHAISENVEFLAVGLSASGSDWVNIKVIRVADKSTEPDSLSWVKFSSITWTHDNKGFFYSRYPAPKEEEGLDAGTEININLDHQLFYHFLGTNQSEDILCWKDSKHPKWIVISKITDDGKYVILFIFGEAFGRRLFYCDLEALPQGLEGFKGSREMLPFQKLVDNFEAQYDLVANDGALFTFRTNKNAPRFKLVRVDLMQPEAWGDVIGESDKDVLASACCVNGNKLLLSYLSDVKSVLQIRDLQSGNLLHNLPIDIGSVYRISGRRKDKEVFIGFTSFLTPAIIYRCNLDVEKPELVVFRETVIPGFDQTEFEAKQVFITSKDRTQIPMFIVSKKDIALDGSHPALLYGYGGFNISVTPRFNIARVVISRHLGAVFAIANIRGGGEYGEEWHKAGSLAKKQNCFDDFISAAEFLVSEGYTQPKKLCIEGTSNGGLLVAACTNQRPDLFGCTLAHVGVMDMLRFHKFTIGRFYYDNIQPLISLWLGQSLDVGTCRATDMEVVLKSTGHAWTIEYGSSEKEEEFHWLIKYSPLHNVKRPWDKLRQNLQYPATMLLTADHDDRVVPLHSLKLLATMQYVLCKSLENSPQTNPIIGRIDTKSGHGEGKPTQKVIDQEADKYAFMAKVVGAPWID